MGKPKKRRRQPTAAELEAQLERARRREAHPAGEYAYRERFAPRVDLTNLDTPDVSHADQWAAFLNRPGRFYVASIEIPLDNDALGEKLGTTTTLKADDDQLPYLVEVLRQVRGALGPRCRITLTPAEPNVEERRIAGPARIDHTADLGHRIDDMIERGSLGTPAAKAYRESVPPEVGDAIVKRAFARRRVADAEARLREREATHRRAETGSPAGRRDWCCGTPITDPHTPGCAFEPREDNPIDYTGPARVATPEELAAVREMRARADARNGFTLPPANGKVEIPDGPPQMYGRDWVREGQEFTREELVEMLPGQTRAEVAQELGKTPEELGGTVHHAEVMPEELAAQLGVPVESLRRIPIVGGGFAWTVTPPPAEEVGRHAAPEGDDLETVPGESQGPHGIYQTTITAGEGEEIECKCGTVFRGGLAREHHTDHRDIEAGCTCPRGPSMARTNIAPDCPLHGNPDAIAPRPIRDEPQA
ncbi:hypothetical protein [Mycolicibacterium mageritense]|uniref:hypothetical protein n=1 Tax=Mycolicibacterium mageritense TaxID=53462 RepID=UPI001E4B0482|nr:hypothetical protein [Mycolicibacterium mageritense]